jgi:hypothetical protein
MFFISPSLSNIHWPTMSSNFRASSLCRLCMVLHGAWRMAVWGVPNSARECLMSEFAASPSVTRAAALISDEQRLHGSRLLGFQANFKNREAIC